MKKKLMLTLFTAFLVITITHGLRRDNIPVSYLQSGGTTSECDSLQVAIETLKQAFPCVIDYCNGGSGGGNITPPTPPPYETTGQPPLPPGVVTTPSPTTTTTTRTATTTTTTKITTTQPLPTTPSTGLVQSGTYIPNWFVYNKHYMGIPKLNVFKEPVSAESAKTDYLFYAKDLQPLAPKLTHIYYSFWNLDPNCHIDEPDPDAGWYGHKQDPTWIKTPAGACKGLLNDMMALKSEFPHLKLLVSLGGWTYSKNFSHCAKTQSNIELVYRTATFRMKQMDTNWGKTGGIWDGFDFDWEFPSVPDGLYPDHDPSDWKNYVKLINYFRTTAHSEGRTSIVLNSAIGVGSTLDKLVADRSVAKGFCDALDFVNLMEYDLHGKWDPTTGHNANFCIDTRSGDPSPKISVLATVNKLEQAGCPSHKMALGLPNFSHAWTRIPEGPHKNGLFSRATSDQYVGWSSFSDSDDSLVPQGIISFWDMKETLNRYTDFQVYSYNCPADQGIVVPIKHVYSHTRQAFASYEDLETIEKKVQWAKKRQLGGYFFWDAQQDKHGDILNTAHSTWGLPTHNRSGTRRCFDQNKINFDVDPSTGTEFVKLCQLTNRSVSFSNGLSGCAQLKAVAERECNGPSTVIGGRRSYSSTCLSLCGPKWGAGDNGPQVDDVVHYACDSETIADPGSSSSPGGGGTSGGAGCDSCGPCKAIPNNLNGVQDQHCAQCAYGAYKFWPCNISPAACQC